MPDLVQLADAEANGRLLRYYEALDTLSRRALSGELNERQYQLELGKIVRRGLSLLFALAGGDITSQAGATAVQQELELSLRSVNVLATDIFDGRYSAIEKTADVVGQTAATGLQKLQNRLTLWAYTAAGVYHLGQEYGDDDERFVWELGGTEVHCVTCLGLDGVVLTAAEWRRLRHRPQGQTLACGGWLCDCGRRPTDRPSVGLAQVSV